MRKDKKREKNKDKKVSKIKGLRGVRTRKPAPGADLDPVTPH
jgi:hypothetical protein